MEIILYILAFVVMITIGVATFLVGFVGGAATGVLYGLHCVFRNMIQQFTFTERTEKAAKPEPTYLNYFFRSAFVENGNFYSESFSECGMNNSEAAGHIDLEFSGNIFYYIIPGYFIGRIVIESIITALLTHVFYLLYFTISCVVAVIIWIVTLLFCMLNFITDIRQKTNSLCTHCGNRLDKVYYLCSNCGATHKKLAPGKLGIFTNKCVCGSQLPCSPISGKYSSGKINACCTHCNAPILDNGFHVSKSFFLVGGTSSGKSCYVTQAITSLCTTASNLQLEVTFPTSDSVHLKYQSNAQQLNNGTLLKHTVVGEQPFYQFYLNNINASKGSPKNLFSVVDNSGDVFENVGEMSKLSSLISASGYILMIDPLSINKFRDELEAKGNSYTHYTHQSPDDIVSTFLAVARHKEKCPVAVVITKSDLPSVQSKIGKQHIIDLITGDGGDPSDMELFYKTQASACLDFMEEYGEYNFINQMKKFKTVQYFVCSSLGHEADGTTFTASGTEFPLLWLADITCKNINLDHVWGRHI